MSTSARRSDLREKRGQVRAQIMVAAAAALRERPYRELTVEELMSAAGLSRTLFYRYFDDLPDVVVRLLVEASADLYGHERRLADTGADRAESIRYALEAPVRTFASHGPLLRAVAEAASHDEQIERGFQSLCDRFGELIEDYLRELASRDRTQLSDPRQAARALNLMNVNYLLDVFGGPEPKVPEAVALRTLTEIWVGAVLHQPPERNAPT